MIKNERGFSLFEMAIVLVIFGLVLASASSVLTLFVNRGGSEKTRQMMEANKNALVSYVQANYELPTTDEFSGSVTYPTDGYNINLYYYVDPILDKSMSTWELDSLSPEINSVCGASYTNTQVIICTTAACDNTDTNKTTVENVAFVMASGGDNKNLQTADVSGVVKVYPQGSVIDANTTVTNRAEGYDDIVDWISLNELRSKVGCDGEYIKFTSQMMPAVKKSTSYSYNFYVEGGIPFNGTSNQAEYEWRFTDTDALGFSVTRRDYNDSQIGTALDGGSSSWVQGHHLKISGNSALGKSQYRIKIDVRDKAQKAKDINSNGYTRTFILNAEQ
ncbi:type II secretion system protein [Seleniivibrio woodruffii]|uniref:Prepilin-type N-terminal cleavage/methylation domain-containing protein n=2 Tax=Seleniivibrio woodruffii TaxID=1078050 RepID=A0A4R1K8H0_9BACT|nr:type II secretion system protein [Seleniivibrio woodruffii]TCK60615.1 prepilin-type N-terminal cleavage/methylation domain-containing protein [Seleniivibrio woodruffii]TVZ36244.1 prepilin-type N-terminal cleavage/methylation domain-containing protein [Seleniivibrio woodruffii]